MHFIMAAPQPSKQVEAPPYPAPATRIRHLLSLQVSFYFRDGGSTEETNEDSTQSTRVHIFSCETWLVKSSGDIMASDRGCTRSAMSLAKFSNTSSALYIVGLSGT